MICSFSYIWIKTSSRFGLTDDPLVFIGLLNNSWNHRHEMFIKKFNNLIKGFWIFLTENDILLFSIEFKKYNFDPIGINPQIFKFSYIVVFLSYYKKILIYLLYTLLICGVVVNLVHGQLSKKSRFLRFGWVFNRKIIFWNYCVKIVYTKCK